MSDEPDILNATSEQSKIIKTKRQKYFGTSLNADLVGDVIDTELKEKPLAIPFLVNSTKQKGKQSRSGQDMSGVNTMFFKEKIKRKEAHINFASSQALKAQILLNEEQGFLVPDEEERTIDIRQTEIVENVDITAATKSFNLKLDFGPYHHRYTRNGRHLLLGGKKGHVAAFDWITRRIHCEINVMEEIADVTWLHVETMFACAQRKWVYFYDNKGTEIHTVKRLYGINKLEFLPYHFLLAGANRDGYLSWLDVSIGELAGHFNSKLGDIQIMRQNPSNGVLCVGGGKGVVSMWSPKVHEPLIKILCHSTPMCSLAIEPKGVDMVTSGLDSTIKVWDTRKMNDPRAVYKIRHPAHEIDISQKGVLSFAMGNICEMYSSIVIDAKCKPYLRQRCDDFIHGLRFCPYEDVLGVSTNCGFQSVIVPGSGESNFDALEGNPFQAKKQRREQEVHALLEKIPAELITLDPQKIAGVDIDTLSDKVEAKKNIFFLKPPRIAFNPRHKNKGRGGSVKAAKNKQIVTNVKRKEFIEHIRKRKKMLINEHKIQNGNSSTPTSSSVLDRFESAVKRKK